MTQPTTRVLEKCSPQLDNLSRHEERSQNPCAEVFTNLSDCKCATQENESPLRPLSTWTFTLTATPVRTVEGKQGG
jgi:hypothetical protein